jgi:hypothetical protein
MTSFGYFSTFTTWGAPGPTDGLKPISIGLASSQLLTLIPGIFDYRTSQ